MSEQVLTKPEQKPDALPKPQEGEQALQSTPQEGDQTVDTPNNSGNKRGGMSWRHRIMLGAGAFLAGIGIASPANPVTHENPAPPAGITSVVPEPPIPSSNGAAEAPPPEQPQALSAAASPIPDNQAGTVQMPLTQAQGK